jgi:hypothetical protein
MGNPWTWILALFLLWMPFPMLHGRFINFKPGYEYVYSFEGHSTVKDLGKFIVKAKVSFL